MKTTHTKFLGVKDCPYTKNGKNLAEIRLAKLRPIAQSLKLNADGTKNEVLGLIIGKLQLLEAPQELSEL